MKKTIITTIGLVGLGFALENSVNGQVRLRALGSDYEALPGSAELVNLESRARLGVKSVVDSNFSALVEIQDSRRMGAESDAKTGVPQSRTTGNSKNLDLHQAYIQIKNGKCEIKLGRQKVAWGSQRLISSLEWNNQARVFDGATMVHQTPVGQIQLLGALIADTGAQTQRDANWLAGGHFSKSFDSLKVEAYGLYDQNRLASMGFANWDLRYLGQRLQYDKEIFLEEEYIWQGGELGALKSNAWQFSSRLGYKASHWSLIAGYDVMSGDDKASDQKSTVYLNPYAFAHQYFGWMDYVMANKADTKSSGIQDLRLDLNYKIKASNLNVAYHKFLSQTSSADLGQEIDAQLTLKPTKNFQIPVGVGIFLPGDSAAHLALLKGKDHWTWQLYLMPTLDF